MAKKRKSHHENLMAILDSYDLPEGLEIELISLFDSMRKTIDNANEEISFLRNEVEDLEEKDSTQYYVVPANLREEMLITEALHEILPYNWQQQSQLSFMFT